MTPDGDRRGIHRVCMTWDESNIESSRECNSGGSGAHKGERVACCRFGGKGRLGCDKTYRQVSVTVLSERVGCVGVEK